MQEQEPPPEGVVQVELYIHYVFSTQDQQPLLTGHIKDQVSGLMGDIARENGIEPLAIGGTENHVHLLLSIPSTLSVEGIVNFIKSGTSTYIQETYPTLKKFAWQQNYFAVGLSKSSLKRTIASIKSQPAFHKTKTFQQEFRDFLAQNKIPYEEKGLWD